MSIDKTECRNAMVILVGLAACVGVMWITGIVILIVNVFFPVSPVSAVVIMLLSGPIAAVITMWRAT